MTAVIALAGGLRVDSEGEEKNSTVTFSILWGADEQKTRCAACLIDEVGTVAALCTSDLDVPDTVMLVHPDGSQKPARKIASDSKSGVTLFSSSEVAASDSAEFGDSRSALPGDSVQLIDGNGNRFPARIAGREKVIDWFLLPTTYLRLAVDGSPGGHGGLVVDAEGKVIALLLEVGPGPSVRVGYALPVEMVEKVARDVRKFGKVVPAWLGFGLEQGTTTPEIVMVGEGSPADEAKLRAGDVLLKIGDRSISSYQDVVDACSYLNAGEEVDFEILRGVNVITLTVTPGFRTGSTEAPVASGSDSN
ncbi:MAG: S1C family serine protease [Verrucomicrobiota bacterium]